MHRAAAAIAEALSIAPGGFPLSIGVEKRIRRLVPSLGKHASPGAVSKVSKAPLDTCSGRSEDTCSGRSDRSPRNRRPAVGGDSAAEIGPLLDAVVARTRGAAMTASDRPRNRRPAVGAIRRPFCFDGNNPARVVFDWCGASNSWPTSRGRAHRPAVEIPLLCRGAFLSSE
jgi:hypothetical protein